MVLIQTLVPILGGAVVAANGGIDETGSFVHGVEPLRQELYVGDSNDNWSCLSNPSVVLNVSQINDGVCDCPDGSDEPGTGACGTKAPLFYCRNEEFIPKYISQSKVNDGVCDCCDCSDELLSPAEPFYRGSGCSELQEAFEKIKKTELKKHEEGSRELRSLYKRFHLKDGSGNVDRMLLAEEIEKISGQLMDSELTLSSLKTKHVEQLKTENPLLYQFKQLDADYIASEIASSFERVVEVSRAYESLVKILDALSDNYLRSLNDRVVNDNVKKYDFMRSQSLRKISCDSKVEEQQRDQLVEYFQRELPQMFCEGKIDKPSKYIIGKITFVESMVFGKVDYVPVVISKIQQLSGLMSEVAENYNVNYQDSGVKEAVESYKHWLLQYQALGDGALLPEEFVEKFARLKEFVLASAGEILASSSGEQVDSTFQGVLQHIKFLARKAAAYFRPNLASEIAALESTMEQLKRQLDTKREQYRTLEDEQQGGGIRELQRLKQLIGALSQQHVLTNAIDNYVYQISLGGPIYQIENSPTGNQVKIGDLKDLRLQSEDSQPAFFSYLKSTYPDEGDLFPALVSETASDQEEYLFGNLHEASNGLVLEYSGGDRCWNGPQRSAQLKVRCAKDFQITKVYEMTKCNYGIEMTGPIGCNLL
ncbi:hypothetical protein HG536_0H02080 [Torulaspora globosa]|uniref:Glucosidase 2 subunit beta n=1 Tax=Torulaspora globosa TaxID=48254 RepID=A0A7G3ZMU7_9SACH|nr:uncharacterized protein HG536_0H02080 [Torulaspora globosa]QLL34833.1 hypothetical protein HG536_0H02080 [Torulaspora globosa]